MKMFDIKLWTVAPALGALLLAGPPAAGQELPNDELENHGQVVRDNAILRHNLEYARKNNRSRNATGASPTPRKAAICAQRPRFAREYGPDHPKLRQLNAMCARDGY